MCKELNNELKNGDSISKELVEHTMNMGAERSERPVIIDGIKWIVIAEQVENDRTKDNECPNCQSSIVDGRCEDVGDNNCGYTTN